MKRSPIARRTPLRSGSTLERSTLQRTSTLARKPFRRRRRRARPGRDDEVYLAWIRGQVCCAPGCGRKPPNDPHHRTGAGMGERAPDREAMPMCRRHHRNIDLFEGPFSGWTQEHRRDWQLAQIAELQKRYARETRPTATATPAHGS